MLLTDNVSIPGVHVEQPRFNLPVADAKHYPRPKLPILPNLGFPGWPPGSPGAMKSAFLGAECYYHQGRYAIARALVEAGVDSSHAVLMPSYHCRSLVEPALFLDAPILFYQMDECLRPLREHLIDLVSRSGVQIRALLLTHYFGFPQDVDWVVQFCREREIVLIEDCAHAFYGEYQGSPLGRHGQFAIASPRKFFPVPDGGILLDNRKQYRLSLGLQMQPVASELKAAAKGIASILKNFNKSEICIPQSVKYNTDPPGVVNSEDVYDTGMKWFKPESVHEAGLRVSRWRTKYANHKKICARRRKNYLLWLAAVEGLNDVAALHSELPEHIVPYMFPLIVKNNPHYIFHILKENGVPLWRWEDMAVTDCRVTNSYRISLLQLPCHQGINDFHIEWMSAVLSLALNNVKKS